MALPFVTSATSCADFGKTVLPYINQLYDLPQKIAQTTPSVQNLKGLYLATNPLVTALAFSLFLVPIFLVISEINKNYSQVDRCWSLLPTIYNAHYVAYAHAIGLPTQRLDSLIIISAVWSARLTFNYWRKGGYSIGSEDYRWNVLKEYINAPLFFLFNVVFISFAQSLLLFSITTPTYILLLTASQSKPNSIDVVFTQILLGFVYLAFTADQQQWDFQQAKKEYQKTAKVPRTFKKGSREDLDRGFVVTGLWKWSRHPNFVSEQSVWIVLYVWSCWVTRTYGNWSGFGALAYLFLFQASTWFTELITARKYPEYKEYQRRVGKFLPNILTSLPGDFSDKKGTAGKAQ